MLAATDPANPYGAALPWPERVVDAGDGERSGHRAGRKAGSLVVTVGGDLILYVERGGRTLLSYADDAELLAVSGESTGRRCPRGCAGGHVRRAGRRGVDPAVAAAGCAGRGGIPQHAARVCGFAADVSVARAACSRVRRR
ncbi:hypothetical protein GCM10020218_005540 [Dactylosporangium vinaceum]